MKVDQILIVVMKVGMGMGTGMGTGMGKEDRIILIPEKMEKTKIVMPMFSELVQRDTAQLLSCVSCKYFKRF